MARKPSADFDLPAPNDSVRTVAAAVGFHPDPRIARWIRVTPADEKPPVDVPVRVVWHERGKSDPRRAVWTGRYWATVKRIGNYEESPDYWLYEPPLPDPPTV